MMRYVKKWFFFQKEQQTSAILIYQKQRKTIIFSLRKHDIIGKMRVGIHFIESKSIQKIKNFDCVRTIAKIREKCKISVF